MAKANHISTNPSRRTLLAGAATLPVVALTPAAIAATVLTEDERLSLLLQFSEATGISLDLIEGVTRGLDRATHAAVLENFLHNVPARALRLRRREGDDPLVAIKSDMDALAHSVSAFQRKRGADRVSASIGFGEDGALFGSVTMLDRRFKPDSRLKGGGMTVEDLHGNWNLHADGEVWFSEKGGTYQRVTA